MTWLIASLIWMSLTAVATGAAYGLAAKRDRWDRRQTWIEDQLKTGHFLGANRWPKG